MRKLYITDIHGCYNEMMKLLHHVEYAPGDDQLVIGGDMIDRGPDSALVLKELKYLQETFPETVHVLMGNHEDMMANFLMETDSMWLGHGGEAIESFRRDFEKGESDAVPRWAISRPVQFEDDEFLYVHAGINPNRTKQLRQEMLWMPYDGITGRRFDSYAAEDILAVSNDKKVIHGHTPKSYLFDDGARICCDLGAAVKDDAKLAIVDLTNDFYHYYNFSDGFIYQRDIVRKNKRLHQNQN